MLEQLRQFEIPGAVSFESGRGGLPKANVRTPWSQAELYLHGAQVTGFQKIGQQPQLFLSSISRFLPGKAIRGGVPICFPWFGSRSGEVAHGFARITDWDVIETSVQPDKQVLIRLRLPRTAAAERWPPFEAEFRVTAGEHLTMELSVANQAGAQTLAFEECLHTYFAVSDIASVSITGLKGVNYLDKTAENASRVDSDEAIRIADRTDRTYVNTTAPVVIHDRGWQRRIRIEKQNSASTVVWNPWTTQVLPDLAAEEYRRMVCVESGNVERNGVSLASGQRSVLRVVLSCEPETVQ